MTKALNKIDKAYYYAIDVASAITATAGFLVACIGGGHQGAILFGWMTSFGGHTYTQSLGYVLWNGVVLHLAGMLLMVALGVFVIWISKKCLQQKAVEKLHQMKE